jgi:hypothetical protein
MKYKKIDELSISDCCAELNIRRNQLPAILENTSGPQDIIDRLKLLVDSDLSAYKSCSTIEQYEAYLASWTDGLHRKLAAQRVTQLKAQAEELAYYKTNQYSISGLESYIRKYPNGKFSKEAKLSLNSKKKVRINYMKAARALALLIIVLTILIITVTSFIQRLQERMEDRMLYDASVTHIKI